MTDDPLDGFVMLDLGELDFPASMQLIDAVLDRCREQGLRTDRRDPSRSAGTPTRQESGIPLPSPGNICPRLLRARWSSAVELANANASSCCMGCHP
ncbi:hypothetical protein [Actinomadura sp. NPDC000600]|uniref:hypothetical protein n=1 Tax=Actinomadura sp. NPDC000600 TaxID=3154262 RepID=UPI003395214A